MIINGLIFGIFISSLLALLHRPGLSIEMSGHYMTINPVFLQTSTGSKGHVLQGNDKGSNTHPDVDKSENNDDHNEHDHKSDGLTSDAKEAESHEANVHDSPTHTEPIKEHRDKNDENDLHDHEELHHDEEFHHDELDHHENAEQVDVHPHNSGHVPEHDAEDYHGVEHETPDNNKHEKDKNTESVLSHKHDDVTDHSKDNVEHKKNPTEEKHEHGPSDTHEDKHYDFAKHEEENKKTEHNASVPGNEHKQDKDVNPHKEEAKPDAQVVDHHVTDNTKSHGNEEKHDVQVNVHEQLHEEHAKEVTPEAANPLNTDLQSHKHSGELSIRKLDSTCPIDCNPACQNMLGGKTQCVKEGGNDRVCTPLNKVETFDCGDGYVPCSVPVISTVQTYTLHKNNNDEAGELDIEGGNLNRCVGLIIADQNSVCSKASLNVDLQHTSNVLNPNYDVTVSGNKLSFSNLHILPGNYKICIYQQYDTSLSKSKIFWYITRLLEFLHLYHSDNNIKTLYALPVGTLVVSN